MQKIPSQLRSNQYEILLKDNIVNFSIRIVSWEYRELRNQTVKIKDYMCKYLHLWLKNKTHLGFFSHLRTWS